MDTKDLKIAMLTMEAAENRRPNTVGSSRIRGRWVMKYMPQIVDFKAGFHYDAVIYQKAYFHEHMKQFKGVKIFDICDPDWMDGRPITEVAQLVDAFTVPTAPLRDFLVQITDKPVIIIPDRIDPEEHTPVKEEHIGKARSVVWFGYSTNQVVLDQCLIYLQQKLLQLVVISDRPYADADVNVKYDYATLNEEMIKHDMVIMPDYKTNLRHSFKSPNKTLTSWALKMPVAVTPEDIARFMDPEERQKEADLRYQEVMTTWHCRESGPQYIDLIADILKKKAEGQRGGK